MVSVRSQPLEQVHPSGADSLVRDAMPVTHNDPANMAQHPVQAGSGGMQPGLKAYSSRCLLPLHACRSQRNYIKRSQSVQPSNFGRSAELKGRPCPEDLGIKQYSACEMHLGGSSGWRGVSSSWLTAHSARTKMTTASPFSVPLLAYTFSICSAPDPCAQLICTQQANKCGLGWGQPAQSARS